MTGMTPEVMRSRNNAYQHIRHGVTPDRIVTSWQKKTERRA